MKGIAERIPVRRGGEINVISIIVIETQDDLKPGVVDDLRSAIGDFFDDREMLANFNVVENALI